MDHKTLFPGIGDADSPEFELYDERSDDSENAEVDIYVPIVSS
jgi:predicted transcriptional regulator YdeE